MGSYQADEGGGLQSQTSSLNALRSYLSRLSMSRTRTILFHSGVMLLLIVLPVAAVRYLGASTDLIRAIPLLFLGYLGIVWVRAATSKSRRRRSKKA
jgi:hypothetical protein